MSEEKQITRAIKYNPDPPKKIEKVDEVDEEEEETSSFLKKAIIITVLLLSLLYVYMHFIETSHYIVKENKVDSTILPDSFHGLKIVHFSDIHYGTTINKKELDKIVKKINKLKPDIIFFTGDLIDKNIAPNETIKEEIISSLSNLECTLYKYAIYGNEDFNNEYFDKIMNAIDFKILNNENILLYYKDTTPIEITGFTPMETSPNYTILTNLVEEYNTESYFKIVLTHEPDSIDSFINYNPSLVLTGHSLGGLVKLPLFKPMFLPENAKNYFEDHYLINNTNIYINNGLGTNNLNIRFNNSPSINLYRLYKIKESN